MLDCKSIHDGSIPSLAFLCGFLWVGGRVNIFVSVFFREDNSVRLEYWLVTPKVAGSNPVFPENFRKGRDSNPCVL